jgi:glycosyltransferase involved in cell wall biosynthesis
MKDNISIVIPTYNRSLLLEKTLEKYLDIVEFTNIEIIVLDNSSTDNTKEMLTDTKFNVLKLKYLCNKVNIGGAANILRSLEVANNNWIWVLPDDCAPNIKGFQNIFSVLRDNKPNFIYLTSDNEPPAVSYTIADIFNGNLIGNLSFLPSIIYNRNLITEHIRFAYSLLSYSYPHLGIIVKSAQQFSKSTKILTINQAYTHTQTESNFYINKYSYVHGSLLRLAQTSNLIYPKKDIKKILKTHAKTSNLRSIVFRSVFWDFKFMSIKTLLNVIYYYGYSNIVSLLFYLFLMFFNTQSRLKIVYTINKFLGIEKKSFNKFCIHYFEREKDLRKDF